MTSPRRLITALVVWLTLGVLMIFWVYTRQPNVEVLLVCALAWFGGIAFAAVVLLSYRHRQSRDRTT